MGTKIKPSLGAGVFPVQEGVGNAPGYAALDVRRSLAVGYLSGSVLGGESSYQCKEKAGGANMSIDIVQAGNLLVTGTTVADQGNYEVYPHEKTINEVIAASNESFGRTDRIVVRVYDNAIDSSGKSEGEVEVIKGTAEAGNTQANRKGEAEAPASSATIAHVWVPAKATTIVASDITDARHGVWRNLKPAAGLLEINAWTVPPSIRLDGSMATMRAGFVVENAVTIKPGTVITTLPYGPIATRKVPLTVKVAAGSIATILANILANGNLEVASGEMEGNGISTLVYLDDKSFPTV